MTKRGWQSLREAARESRSEVIDAAEDFLTHVFPGVTLDARAVEDWPCSRTIGLSEGVQSDSSVAVNDTIALYEELMHEGDKGFIVAWLDQPFKAGIDDLETMVGGLAAPVAVIPNLHTFSDDEITDVPLVQVIAQIAPRRVDYGRLTRGVLDPVVTRAAKEWEVFVVNTSRKTIFRFARERIDVLFGQSDGDRS